MTKDQLDAIRKRCEASSPGPWTIDRRNVVANQVKIGDAKDDEHWGFATVEGAEKIKNAEFIAHARQDIPALLSEIERLESEAEDRERRVRAEAFKEAAKIVGENLEAGEHDYDGLATPLECKAAALRQEAKP